tara:strand:+ start:90476 stop:90769 length:294 start_codon:yes stop_codon:yes gene_type:complete
MKKLSYLLFCSLFLISCKKSDCENSVKATFVDKTGLDGCGMVIEVSDDEYVEPRNLDEFSINPKDGMKIWVTYDVLTDQASICMIGDVVEVKCIKER